MIITKRQPVSAGEMLIEEFMEPLAVYPRSIGDRNECQPPNDQRNLQQQTLCYGGHGIDIG
jgi:hypothetical protein